jgi:hypothetical protein
MAVTRARRRGSVNAPRTLDILDERTRALSRTLAELHARVAHLEDMLDNVRKHCDDLIARALKKMGGSRLRHARGGSRPALRALTGSHGHRHHGRRCASSLRIVA